MADGDYSFGPGGQIRRTAHSSYSEQSYQVTSSGKPPSPSLSRRGQQPQPQQQPGQPLSSPNTVRRASPQRQLVDTGNVGQYKYTTTSYTTSSTSGGGGGRQSPHPSHPSYPMPPEKADPVPVPVRTPSQPPPPQPQPQPQPPRDGTPTGVAYYSKYHSSQTHSSSNRHYGGSGPPPASFPGGTSPAPPRSNAFAPQQTPPKRVDQLMTELSEFDSSIQDTRFVEPIEQQRRDPSPEPYRPYRESSPERPPKQQSTPGPAVYYPPGEMFTTTTRTQQVYSLIHVLFCSR